MANATVRRGRSNDPEAMRRRVLDVAAAAFQKRGYHSTSTHDIMREAGVTGGALHHHFPTKKALGSQSFATGLRKRSNRPGSSR
jgi:TetR/AcrR family transcriptional repressor of nem operon